jgi:hypothetical protein
MKRRFLDDEQAILVAAIRRRGSAASGLRSKVDGARGCP